MALGTGTITLSQIKSEFGGTTLTSHLKGGGFVAAHENNASVPSSGTISISNFRSTATVLVDKDMEGLSYTDGSDVYSFVQPDPPYDTEYVDIYGGANVPTSDPNKIPFVCGAIGVINFVGLGKANTTQAQFLGAADYYYDDGTGLSALYFAGDRRGTWWTSVTINGVTANRGSDQGTYESDRGASGATGWFFSQGSGFSQTGIFQFNGTGTFDVRIVL